MRRWLITLCGGFVFAMPTFAVGPYGVPYGTPLPAEYGYSYFRTVADKTSSTGAGAPETLPAPPPSGEVVEPELDLLSPAPGSHGLASPPSPGVSGFPGQGNGALSAPPSYPSTSTDTLWNVPSVAPAAPGYSPSLEMAPMEGPGGSAPHSVSSELPPYPPVHAPAPVPYAGDSVAYGVPAADCSSGPHYSSVLVPGTTDHVNFGSMFSGGAPGCGQGCGCGTGAACSLGAWSGKPCRGVGLGLHRPFPCAAPGGPVCTVGYDGCGQPPVGCHNSGPIDEVHPMTFEGLYRTPDCYRSLWAGYSEEKARDCDKCHAHLRGGPGCGGSACGGPSCGGQACAPAPACQSCGTW